jgi:Holliday junction resolvase
VGFGCRGLERDSMSAPLSYSRGQATIRKAMGASTILDFCNTCVLSAQIRASMVLKHSCRNLPLSTGVKPRRWIGSLRRCSRSKVRARRLWCSLNIATCSVYCSITSDLSSASARKSLTVTLASRARRLLAVRRRSKSFRQYQVSRWNPAKEDQATDRAYRIGQTKPVHVYCPLTVAKDFKTFDVKLDELLSLKRALATDMLRGAGGLSSMDFDLRDIAPEGARHLNDEPITPEVLERMAPRFFEGFIAALWRKRGFARVELTPQSDAGVDVIALRGATGALIQCKSSARQGAKLGWEAVKEVVGGTAIYSEHYPGVTFSRICVTNQFFNATAHDRAKANGVAIVEQDELLSLLQKHPLTKLDVMSRFWNPTGRQSG